MTLRIAFVLFSAILCSGCSERAFDAEARSIGGFESEVLGHPPWSGNASIYEVNIRQHTMEGTLNAFVRDIPRIKQMGIDILWLMPIFPIGEINRKGSLGNCYSVRDYYKVNPEFGNLDDLIRLVKTAHNYDMKVILDWVANHSSWDNEWVEDHPEYYSLNEDGEMFSPVSDWSDMVDFDYENEGLRGEMIKAMKHWVTVADVDGFRCDGAMLVPQNFWESVRLELEKLKPEIFMLAEAEQPSLHHKAFDMSYSWEFLRVANNIAEGDMKLSDLESYVLQAKASFVVSAYRMYFTTNHDENTLNGTVFERFGAAHKLYAVLAFTLDGMPLLYSGQEAGNPKRLASFEKDTIVWGEYMFQDFYTDLLHAKKENEALWNGSKGGPFERINTNKDEQIFAYTRVKNDNRIVVFLNFSDAQIQFETEHVPDGKFRNIFGDKSLFFFINDEMSLEPWGFQVFVSETKSKTKSADS